MTYDFKPCPFCGYGHAIFLEKSPILQNGEKRKNRAIRVECAVCKSSTGDFDLYQAALKAWNRRMIDPTIQKQIDQMRLLIAECNATVIERKVMQSAMLDITHSLGGKIS